MIERSKMEIIKEISSETLTIHELKDFIGKKVRINIEELTEERGPIEKEHKPLGRYKLGRELDQLNIRDFALKD
jgi:hypothetical protein